jgi:hypothetical protein
MAVRWFLGVGIAVGVALCAVAQEPAQCALFSPGSESATSAPCLSCHVSHSGMANHSIDVPYAAQGSDLRPIDEVRRRGVRIPDGEVRCTSCHDWRSPWRYRVALPPGAPALRAVDLRDRATYENPPRPAQPGEEVGASRSASPATRSTDAARGRRIRRRAP